ncbi:hypothetical protein [Cellvibrio sp. QJXJ]|uniref:hypothetical protein n=1 Tax=Cellvibrio sp. QJXJ TaxID=2964606 RepID=UPI0021C4762E|nr:hypothetical protein [Cellvibrio sp. QJXJ]UUA73938.1 hypothetical protein NNX04_05710 [Cellvibrio sp. QJXJ]
MSYIEVFAEQKKKRIIYTAVFAIFFLVAVLLRHLYEGSYIFTVRADIVAAALQVIGLPFIFLSIKYIKCPSCKESAGSGWNIKECKNCGEKLK